MILAYKYRIYPTRQQAENVSNQFMLCCWLYNCALEERITAYKSLGKVLSNNYQLNQLPDLKIEFPEFNKVHSQVLQNVLKRLDISFTNFFRRVKNGEKPGFPRFKKADSFSCMCYPQAGFKINGNKVYIPKVGCVKIKLHRGINGVIKTCSIKKSGSQWYIIFTIDNNLLVDKLPISNSVGIDLGLESFAVMSDGAKIENPRRLIRSEATLKEIQSKYSKYKGKSTKRKLLAVHRKIANQRNDFLHKQSRLVVNKYGLIAYEDLNIQKMIGGRFSKSIHDVAWGKFIQMLKYKAESAGTYAIAVNPCNTSKICSGCGAVVEKKLFNRSHDCPVCGLSLHRDLNASINILRSGIGLLEAKT